MINTNQQQQLFENGFVELPQLKFDDSIDNIRKEFESLNKTYNSGTDFHKKYLEKHKIKTSLRDVLVDFSKKYLNITPDKDDIYTISRLVQSYDNLESYRGHFDSHIFTLVTPVIIPSLNDPESGQLIVFPKIRKEPSSELSNVLGKLKFNLLYSNKKGFQNLMDKNVFCEFDFTNLNPILFLGRQCFHGNRSFAKAPNGIRVTLLTHFFDPNSKGLGSLLRKLRNR